MDSRAGTQGNGSQTSQLDVERAVRDRYSEAARETVPALCCPVEYNAKYLEVLPDELLDRDYGCGDPSEYLQSGETVLDLGSGAGKICYIASQVVGPQGTVIGVDANREMLALARRHQQEVGERIGHQNIRFLRGRIQDLGLDLDKFEAYLVRFPVESTEDWLRAEAEADRLRVAEPLIASGSVDVVVSNCVLNLVRTEDRRHLFDEIYRVLRRGGRAVISDIVSDEPVPGALRKDPELWSGCISGAFVEHELLKAFEDSTFYGLRILSRQAEPWSVVEGIEFRSVTVEAFKGKEGPCLDCNQAVVYSGPWRSVTDDDGHVLHRGRRSAVCEKTFQIYTRPPYADQILPVPPHTAVSPDKSPEFDGRRGAIRDPRETKGADYVKTVLPAEGDSCCGPDGCAMTNDEIPNDEGMTKFE